MKKIISIIFLQLLTAPGLLCAQSQNSGTEPGKTDVYDLAVWTVDHNTDGLLLKAGAD